MPLVTSSPYQQARMVADTINSAYYVLYKYTLFQWPVRRAFKLTLCITGYPKVRPYHFAVLVCRIPEIIRRGNAATPNAYQVYIGIAAKVHFIIVAGRITVHHKIRYPGATYQVYAFPVHKKIAS